MALTSTHYHSETFGCSEKNSWISDLQNGNECDRQNGGSNLRVNENKQEQRNNNNTSCYDESVCKDETQLFSPSSCPAMCLSDKDLQCHTKVEETHHVKASPDASPIPSTEEKPQDARPKMVTRPQSKTLQGKMKASSRRKKKNKSRSRIKLDSKWKTVDPFEIGFHVVSSLSEPDVSLESEDICDTTNDTVNGAATCIEVSSSASSNVGVCQSSSTEDDAAFFLSLGVDVAYSGPYYDDGVLDWDGLSFKNDIPVVKFQNVPVLQTSLKVSKNNNSKSKIARLKNAASTSDSRTKAQSSDFLHSIDCPGLDNISNNVLYKLFELECSSLTSTRARSDRDRRTQKAHKSIKTKHCLSIKNNSAGKLLYMHHRLYKKLEPTLGFSSYDGRTYLTKTPKGYDRVKDAVVKTGGSSPRSREPRVPPAQNLKYALDNTTAPRDIDNQLAAFLISLQHREMTPEDYDMLLQLDDSVKPKTVQTSVLKKLKTSVVPPSGLEAMCAVCMEPYQGGQERKFLPCGHDYHSSCIDTWLNNSSMNCPLDGLPVYAS